MLTDHLRYTTQWPHTAYDDSSEEVNVDNDDDDDDNDGDSNPEHCAVVIQLVTKTKVLDFSNFKHLNYVNV